MKNQFATYEISLSLRELKFEEPCLGYFSGKDREVFVDNKFVQPPYNPNLTSMVWFRAPLWQQVIDWFRVKHKMEIYINKSFSMFNSYHYLIATNDKIDSAVQQESIPNRTFEECREQAILQAIKLLNQ